MTINTAANIGDKIWTQYHSVPLTIGQIRVCLTDSRGINGGDPEGIGVEFHNYMPQKEYVEEYMCEETGIGSGSVYTLGESAFLTKDEMEKAKAKLGK